MPVLCCEAGLVAIATLLVLIALAILLIMLRLSRQYAHLDRSSRPRTNAADDVNAPLQQPQQSAVNVTVNPIDHSCYTE